MRIHVLAAALSCAVLVGCGGGSSSNTTPPTPPPAPPSPTIAVTAPQDGSTVYGAPVTISITAKNLSDASQLGVRLNGADITSQLSAADSNGVRTVQVSQPDLNYGKNQIQVRYQSTIVNSNFTLNTGSAAGSAPGSTQSAVDPSTQLVGITTRVLQPGTTGTLYSQWGIQLNTSAGNNTYYWSNQPINQNSDPCSDCSSAFQIVLLNRQDLHLVSNTSYETTNPQEWGGESPFVLALASAGYGPSDAAIDGVVVPTQKGIPGCQPLGCIMIIQSLTQIGSMPCYYTGDASRQGQCQWDWETSNTSHATFNLAYWLTKLGASGNVLFANGGNKNVGYSFIGNAGTGQLPGTGVQISSSGNGYGSILSSGNQNSQFERLGCLDTTFQNPVIICDNLGKAGISYNSGGSTDLQQAGRISGVLIRDNYALFTFSQSMRQIAYTFGTTVSQGGSPQAGGTYTNLVTIDGQGPSSSYGYYPNTITLPAGAGAFRLLVLDRTHPDWDPNVAVRIDKFYKCCGSDNELQQLQTDIAGIHDSNNLFFLGAVGFVQHDIDTPFAATWEQQFVQSVHSLGADPITARILGDRHNAFDPDSDPRDDYLLVGKTVASSPPFGEEFTAGTQGRYTAQESGYVINRHTLKNAPYPTQVEGVLVPDHQGYYTPHMQGLQTGIIVPQVASLSSASLQLPSIWPYSQADTGATNSEKAAYNWISSQLCCSDIRQTYTNLNVSPSSWSAQLDQLTYPQDQSSNFSAQDLDNVRKQLALEFGYVADTRNLLNNILSLYQSQQSNVGLILTQAASDIDAQLDLKTPPRPSPSPWSILTSDVFPVLANLALFAGPEAKIGTQFAIAGFDNALGIGSLVIDNATDHTNDATGVSQQMQALSNENIAEANLAEYEADQYVDSLATLGNDFKRVVTNWASLQAIGAPIESGQLSWDPLATSFYLRAFDLATRQQFFPQLINGSKDFYATHIKYADWQYYGSDDDYQDSHGNDCSIEEFHDAQDNLANPGYYVDSSGTSHDMRMTAWWPGVVQTSGLVGSKPNAYWWDIWALQENNSDTHECPDVQSYRANTFGMFDPIDFNNPQSSGLGLWKPYTLQYVITPLTVHKNQNYDSLP